MPIALPIGFRMTTGNLWLLRQALRLFRNAMRYWKADVEDDDFFVLFRDPTLSSIREAKTMLKRHFTLDELARGGHVEVVHANGDSGGRITDVTLPSLFSRVIQELWNRGKKERSRCRRMLEEWCDAIERRKFRPRKHKDPTEARMDEICRLFQFDKTARDIFLFAVLRDQSLACHPHTRCRNQRQYRMSIAMAIDRPFSAVEKALSGDAPFAATTRWMATATSPATRTATTSSAAPARCWRRSSTARSPPPTPSPPPTTASSKKTTAPSFAT